MKFLLTFVGVVIGAIVGQTQGAIWGGIIGFLASFASKSSRSAAPASPTQPRPTPVSSPRITEATVPPTRVEFRIGGTPIGTSAGSKPLRWIDAEQSIAVAGITIHGGMLYVSDGAPNTVEPSVINRKLTVHAATAGQCAQLPYFPSYDTITPQQRRIYLEWLAQGRRDAEPSAREFGYLFLFFYGLERRVLVDGDSSANIGEEVARLMEIYSPFGRSKSLPSYFSQLLHFWAFHQGAERYAQLWPWILSLEHSVLDADELQLVLGNLAAAGQNAPARVAREIAFHSEGATRSNVATRSPQEFRTLFDQRFANEFPSGLPLLKGQRTVTASYLPASAVLRYQAESTHGRFVARTDHVSLAPRDRIKLIQLWNACCSSLSGYVRAKAKSTGEHFNLSTLLATPPELRARQLAAWSNRLEELLTTAAKDEGFRYLAASSLCTFFGLPVRERYTVTQSKQVAEALEAFGWLIEPDPRSHGATLSNQEVVLFKGGREALSAGFLGRCALVQLSVTLAGSDDSFDLRESETVFLLIDGSEAPEAEKQRLRAWAMLLARDINNAPATVTKVAKAIPASNRQAIAQLLCRIVTADGIVTKGELRMLDRIFRGLELAPEVAALLKKELDGFDEISIARPGPPTPGERIPGPTPHKVKPRFELDRDRVRALTEETAEVIHILSVAMADAEHEPEKTVVTPPPKREIAAVWRGLDAKYAALAERLVERDTWTRPEFDALAVELHLMPTAAFDAINEWADDALGDFLLQGDDAVEVKRALLPSPSPSSSS